MDIKLKKVKLEKDDVILFEIDPDIIDVINAKELYNQLQVAFPDNRVFAYLKGIDIHITKEKDCEYIRGWISTS